MSCPLHALTLLISCKQPPSYSTFLLSLLSPTWNLCKKLITWMILNCTDLRQKLSTVPTREEDANQEFARLTHFFSCLAGTSIRIKSLSSKLCVSDFLHSLRCFWHSQVTVWPGSVSAPLPSHSFPKHMKCIHFHTLSSILWTVFCLHEIDLLKLTSSNLVKVRCICGTNRRSK